MSSFFSRLLSNKHFKNGLPFFCFIGGGAFTLKQFRSVRYDSDLNPNATKFLTPEEAFGDKAEGINLKPKRTLEEDLELLNEKVDSDNWEQKRMPRPWEGTVEARPVARRLPAPTVKEMLGE